MEQLTAQTEKITSYESSRTKRSLIDGTIHSDDSNNDGEFASSGFYVREKTSEKSENKKPDSSNSPDKDSEKECKENGTSEDKEAIVTNEAESSSLEVPAVTDKSSKAIVNEDSREETSEDVQENSKDEEEEEEQLEKSSLNNDPKQNNDMVSESDKEEKENKDEGCKDDSLEEEIKKTKQNESLDQESKELEENKEAEDNKEIKKTNDNKEVEENEDKENDQDVEMSKDEKEENKEAKDKNEDKQDNSIELLESEDGKENNSEVKDKEKNSKTISENVDSSLEIIEDKGSKENAKDVKDVVENEKSKDIKEDDQKENKDNSSDASILKEQLIKEKSSEVNNEAENDMDMDDDFDPSLLCPDISMDVDEAPVITNDNPPNDGSTSPLPYEPVFSHLVDEMTGTEVINIELTPEEMAMRQRMYGPDNPVQKSKVHCTACNIHLGSALDGQKNRFVHPLLKVLICKNCYHFYTSGEFEKDEDGSELYCRWCGQGGQVLCCSSCEFVFCKRCIKNNFGQKKFKEIRDSDDWNCYRCHPEQLSLLRASCAEFMEYYRTELARAHSLSQTKPELMSTDYTKCCNNAEKKADEQKAAVAQRKRKRKPSVEDPDYKPVFDEEELPKKRPFTGPSQSTPLGYTTIKPATTPVIPKPSPASQVRPIVVQPRPQAASGQIFRVGNTTFRSKGPPTTGPGYTVTRPTVSGPRGSSPGYIKILPQRMATPRPQLTPTSSKPTFTTVRPGGANKTPQIPAMKHEWFEKTVRAAARVNSNLSYTLTQLNRQQSQAGSVEALAMVHNKLQEVLSTSINSLIQIRKNLRTEFISGIKNIKFPPKLAPMSTPSSSKPIVVKDDDDVIFVNPPTTQTLSSPPPLIISPSVTLTKRTPIQKSTSDQYINPKPSTSFSTLGPSTSSSNGPTKGGFLKVRSFSALQTVTSECITIPDDPPQILDEKTGNMEDPLKITEEEETQNKEANETTEDKDESSEAKDESSEAKDESSEAKDESSEAKDETASPTNMNPDFDIFMTYNVKEDPTPDIKKMLNAVVMVNKSRVIDEIIRAEGKLLNGCGNEKEETS